MRKKIKLMISRTVLFAVLVWFPLVTSCSTVEKDLPPEGVSLSKYACTYDDDLFPHVPLNTNEQIKAPALAGGTVMSGDFLISLWLMCDPSLSSGDPMSDFYSDVRNLAFLYTFKYLGKPLDQAIHLHLTANDETINSFTYSAGTDTQILIVPGPTSHIYAPIITKNQVVARSLVAGEPIDFLLTISTSQLLASAQLTASFEETLAGYRLSSAEILEK